VMGPGRTAHRGAVESWIPSAGSAAHRRGDSGIELLEICLMLGVVDAVSRPMGAVETGVEIHTAGTVRGTRFSSVPRSGRCKLGAVPSPGRRDRGGPRSTWHASCGDGHATGLRMMSKGVPSRKETACPQGEDLEMTPCCVAAAACRPRRLRRGRLDNGRADSKRERARRCCPGKTLTSMTWPLSPWGTLRMCRGPQGLLTEMARGDAPPG